MNPYRSVAPRPIKRERTPINWGKAVSDAYCICWLLLLGLRLIVSAASYLDHLGVPWAR